MGCQLLRAFVVLTHQLHHVGTTYVAVKLEETLGSFAGVIALVATSGTDEDTHDGDISS